MPLSKWTAIHLPKRDELLLYTVLALPIASSRNDDSSAASVMPPELWLSAARQFMQIFVVSVLPAPDSPETRMLCAPPPRMFDLRSE